MEKCCVYQKKAVPLQTGAFRSEMYDLFVVRYNYAF